MSQNQTPREVASDSDERTDNNTNAMRHNYRVLSEQEKADMVEIKDAGLSFLKMLDRFPQSREMSLARTNLEQAVMWAVKSITK